ncbi:MAG TPA: Gfo/Idh/MocA family oxidoreductase, partial [Rugosimonospora sp.]|nr:Gfo/Idh/MocA family oxidoreductase [Rugosimonospora sp.]
RKVVVVEDTVEHAAAAATSLGYESSTADWAEAVSRPDVDIVDICTPNQFHAPVALAALAHGKHVFCEKPLAAEPAEAVEMARRAAEAGVVTQVGFNYRHTPAISFVKQLLDNGELGRPLQFRASYLGDGSFWADPNRWRARRSTGGTGTIADVGSHVIDASEYLMGEIRRVVSLVRAKDPTAAWYPESTRIADSHLDEAGVWLAEYGNGAIGTFAVSSYSTGRKNRYAFDLDATKGAVEFNWNRRDEIRVSYVDERPDHRGTRTIVTGSQHPDPWWRVTGLGLGYVEVSAIQFRHFIRAIVDGTRARPDFTDAVRVEHVVAAIHESARTGGWVSIDRTDGNDHPAGADGRGAGTVPPLSRQPVGESSDGRR